MTKILAIDDIYDNLIVLKALLSEAFPAIEFFSALSGHEGLALCYQEMPDVVLLDNVMPGMNGYEVCKVIKSDNLLKSIPVIMITAARNDQESRIMALESGADAFLAKPVDESEFKAQVRAMLRIKESEDKKQNVMQNLERLVAQRTEALERELKYRKKTEEALRISEETYRELYEKSPIGYQSLDENGNFLTVNEVWLKTLGYSREEVIGKWFGDFLAPGYEEAFRERFPLFKAKSKVHSEFYMIKKDGSYAYVAFEGRIGYDANGKFKQTHCVLSDITERKLAEDKIYQSEKLYRTLVETSPDGIGMADLQGKIISANQRSCQIFGFKDEEELKSTRKNFIDFISPADQIRASENLKLRSKGDLFISQEYMAIRKDGLEFPIELKSSVVYDPQNLPYAIISVMADITQRRRIEDTHNFLLNAGRANYGEDFFQSLSIFLAKSLGMCYVCINSLKPDSLLAQTLSIYLDGRFLENMTYSLHESPCGQVVGKTICCFERNVSRLFPQNSVLQDIGAESYIGTTLWSSTGKPIGLIAIVGRQPLENTSVIESVLNLVSIRAAGELERRDTELELLKSRQSFENYFNNCSVGMSVTLPDKKWLEVNHSLCQMLGYTKEELAGLTWLDLTHPDDVDKNISLFSDMADGKIDRYEMDKRFVRKDGSLVYVSLSVVCERNSDGSVDHLLASYIDVTARQLAEDTIRRERSLLRTLIDNLPNTIYVKNTQGQKIVSNKADLEHMGFTSEAEIIGKTDIDLFQTSDGVLGYEEDMSVIQTGVSIINKESLFINSSGKLNVRVNSKFPLYDENSTVQGLVGIGVDITEQKMIEEALKSSEELYRNLVERMPDGVYKSTPNGKFVSVNPAMVDMLGYDSKEELMAINIKSDLYFAPEERDSLILNEQNDVIEVFKLKKKDGSEIWVEDHGWYNNDEEGNTQFHEGILRDVTDRKKVEDKLRSLSRAVEQNPASIVITNTLGQIKYVNPNFTELTGYTLGEVYDKTPRIFKSGLTSADEYEHLWRTIIAGNEWRGEFRNKKKSGEEYFEKATISPIKDENGNTTHFLAVKEDITDSKRAKEALLKSEERIRMHIQNTPIATVEYDKDFRFTGWNPAAEHIFGFTAAEALGQLTSLIIPGNKESEVNLAMQKVIDQAIPSQNINENITKSGEIITCEWYNSPLVASNGAVSGLASFAIDITEKKRMLNEMIAAKEKAEESDRLKTAFLATMNHELRTPLNHILGFSELILSGVAPEDNPSFALSIQASGQSLLAIIEDVFDLALVEQANIKLRNQTFSLMDHFMENKASFDNILRTSAKHEQIQLIFKPDTRWLSSYVTADRSKINQVLTNLFKNAIKFTQKGTIEFGYKIDNQSNLTFYVKDTGIGIPKEKHSIIFDFFRQGDDSTTRAYGGIGIGLAISQKITKILKGELMVVSEPGVGSTFSLTIPVELSEKQG